jgi:hypothetical protein
VTLLDFMATHPFVSVALVLAAGYAVGGALAAPVTAWRKLQKRPDDCPRCDGTGRAS